jgi:hypothetical protein
MALRARIEPVAYMWMRSLTISHHSTHSALYHRF